MKVVILPPSEWAKYSEQAHMTCFQEMRPTSLDRIDFALVADLDGIPQAYMTCREIDSDTVYMQYGGAFPSARGTIKSFQSYQAMLEALSGQYKQATTLIENTNTPMLKFAMSQGLRIIGVRNFKGSILLEHFVQWRD